VNRPPAREPVRSGLDLARAPRRWGQPDQVLVGGPGHYLNSQIDLAGGVLNLLRRHHAWL
jgi:hypothetical protein